MKWFRFYHEADKHDKILELPVEVRWNWVQLLCVASQQIERGTLPSLERIRIELGISKQKADKVVRSLMRAGLIDKCEDGNGLRMHNWEERQRKSDTSAERVKKLRDTECNVTKNPNDIRHLAIEGERDTDSSSEESSEGERETESPPPEISRPEANPATSNTVIANPRVPAKDPAIDRLAERTESRWPMLEGGRLAADLCYDYPVAWVSMALDKTFNRFGSNELPRAWPRTILQDWYAKGGPPVIVPANQPLNRRPEKPGPEYIDVTGCGSSGLPLDEFMAQQAAARSQS